MSSEIKYKINRKLLQNFPFLRSGSFYGLEKNSSVADQRSSPSSNNNSNNTKKGNCLYLTQYCLIRLGDLARYRFKSAQAEYFYLESIGVRPGNGQAYNQLALLQSTPGESSSLLNPIFYYVRALALKFPFPGSAGNLEKLFDKIIDERNAGDNHDLTGEILTVFAFSHQTRKLSQAVKLCQNLQDKFRKELTKAADSNPKDDTQKWIRIVAVCLYLIEERKSEGGSQTKDEIRSKEILLEILSSLLDSFLLPIHTSLARSEPEELGEYFALKPVKLVLEWISLNPDVSMKSKGFLKRPQIWVSVSKLLNRLRNIRCQEVDESSALSEDFELQGFLPLNERFKNLDFSGRHKMDENSCRAKRLIQIGKGLRNLIVINSDGDFEAADKMQSDVAQSLELSASSQSSTDSLPLPRVESADLPSSSSSLANKKSVPRRNVAMNAILKSSPTQSAPDVQERRTTPTYEELLKSLSTQHPTTPRYTMRPPNPPPQHHQQQQQHPWMLQQPHQFPSQRLPNVNPLLDQRMLFNNPPPPPRPPANYSQFAGLNWQLQGNPRFQNK